MARKWAEITYLRNTAVLCLTELFYIHLLIGNVTAEDSYYVLLKV
jgi:hypothetical protein